MRCEIEISIKLRKVSTNTLSLVIHKVRFFKGLSDPTPTSAPSKKSCLVFYRWDETQPNLAHDFGFIGFFSHTPWFSMISFFSSLTPSLPTSYFSLPSSLPFLFLIIINFSFFGTFSFFFLWFSFIFCLFFLFFALFEVFVTSLFFF